MLFSPVMTYVNSWSGTGQILVRNKNRHFPKQNGFPLTARYVRISEGKIWTALRFMQWVDFVAVVSGFTNIKSRAPFVAYHSPSLNYSDCVLDSK